MTTAQDPPKRNRQKRRRTKKLEAWREKNAKTTETKAPAATAKAAAKAPSKAPAKAPAKVPAKKATK